METSDEPTPSAPTGRAAFEAELAALREENAASAPEESTFGDALKAAGIDFEARPVTEDAEEPEEPAGSASAPERDEQGRFAPKGEEKPAESVDEAEDGLDVFMDAARPQDPRRERAKSLEAEALELGMSAKDARVLANNMSPELARKTLDAERSRLQLGAAEESAPTPQAPPSAGAAEDALAQLGRALEEESGGETAQAAISVIQALQAQTAELTQRLSSVEGLTQAQQEADLSAKTRAIVDGLAGEFPEIVRDGKFDPAVSKHAALLFTNGTPLEDAWRKAARAEYGAVQPDRQVTTATPGPDVSAPPASANVAPTRKLTGPEQMEMFRQIEVKYGNDEAKLAAAYAKTKRYIREHNARAAS